MEELYDKNKFLGEYVFSNYIVNRSYLPGNGTHNYLFIHIIGP